MEPGGGGGPIAGGRMADGGSARQDVDQALVGGSGLTSPQPELVSLQASDYCCPNDPVAGPLPVPFPSIRLFP